MPLAKTKAGVSAKIDLFAKKQRENGFLDGLKAGKEQGEATGYDLGFSEGLKKAEAVKSVRKTEIIELKPVVNAPNMDAVASAIAELKQVFPSIEPISEALSGLASAVDGRIDNALLGELVGVLGKLQGVIEAQGDNSEIIGLIGLLKDLLNDLLSAKFDALEATTAKGFAMLGAKLDASTGAILALASAFKSERKIKFDDTSATIGKL